MVYPKESPALQRYHVVRSTVRILRNGRIDQTACVYMTWPANGVMAESVFASSPWASSDRHVQSLPDKGCVCLQVILQTGLDAADR